MFMQQLDSENLIQKDAGNTKKALVKLGILTVGTQLGTAVIHRMTKHPVLLFGLGIAAGLYVQKNRKQIILAGEQLTHQGKKLLHLNPALEKKRLPNKQ